MVPAAARAEEASEHAQLRAGKICVLREERRALHVLDASHALLGPSLARSKRMSFTGYSVVNSSSSVVLVQYDPGTALSLPTSCSASLEVGVHKAWECHLSEKLRRPFIQNIKRDKITHPKTKAGDFADYGTIKVAAFKVCGCAAAGVWGRPSASAR